MINNFLITGKPSIGKSYLVNSLINNLNLEVTGFKTLPYYIENDMKGYCYHSIENLTNIKNDLPINIIYDKKNNIPIIDVFKTLGIQCLKNSLNSNKTIILLDEIGRIERNCTEYIDLINSIFDSDKCVLAVLKKEKIDFIDKIKSRKDVLLLDLDNIEYEKAYSYLNKKIKEILQSWNYQKKLLAQLWF